MTADTTDRDLTFTIRALDDPGGVADKPVPADVFAKKMQEILDGLREADKSANHGRRFEYFIVDLKKGSAEVTFEERPLPAFEGVPIRSSMYEFESCVDALYRNDVAAARQFNGLVEKVLKIAIGAGERFAHINIARRDGHGHRADKLFLDMAQRVATELKAERVLEARHKLFRGQSFEGFDGHIKEVDLREKSTKRCMLVLSDGTGELACEFVNFSLQEIKDYLDCRVWAEGSAVYSGERGMPVRLDIRSLRKIEPKNHLSKWRGKVERSEGDDWLE